MLEMEALSLADVTEARVRDFAAGRLVLSDPANATCAFGQPTPREQAAMDRLSGARISEARKLAELSIETLASLAGVPRRQLVELESGRASAPVWLLAKIATLTATTVDYLVGVTDESETGEAPSFRTLLLPILLRADEQRAIRLLELQRQRPSRVAAANRQAAAKTAQQALQRVIELNPDTWPEIRGGSLLERALITLVEDYGHKDQP